MPITKHPKSREPLWKEWNFKADKKGVHSTVYSVNGNQYTGDWDKNMKNGKGTMVWKKTGAIYDGDWKDDNRHGFGTLSYPVESGGYRKVYSGGWKNDKRHGYGSNFYSSSEEYFEGEWYADKRSGWGRMYYKDGSVYEGEWYNGMRNGEGMLRLADENRYEGSWKDDKKHGHGKFYYLDKGQLYTGVWVEDIPKCGTMEDFGREGAPDPTTYPIPECTLLDTEGVVREAENTFTEDQE